MKKHLINFLKMMIKQLKSLTGMRFFASIFVVAHHFGTQNTPGALKNFINHGFVGVTLFFILSGFILTYNYIGADGCLNTSKRNFWIARVARIYPVYLLGFILFVPIVILWSKQSIAKISSSGFATLVLAQAWLPSMNTIWNPPGWSLSAEAFFYLLFPLAAPIISKMQLKTLSLTALGIWIFSLFAVITYVATSNIDRNLLMFNPMIRLPEFLLGIALCRFWMAGKCTFIARYADPIAIGTITLLAVILSFDINDIFFYNGSCAPLMMLLILSLASGTGISNKILGAMPFVILGEASYALYILHWPLWFEITKVLSYIPGSSDKSTLHFFKVITVMVVISIICFHVLERPASKLLRKKLTGGTKKSEMVS